MDNQSTGPRRVRGVRAWLPRSVEGVTMGYHSFIDELGNAYGSFVLEFLLLVLLALLVVLDT